MNQSTEDFIIWVMAWIMVLVNVWGIGYEMGRGIREEMRDLDRLEEAWNRREKNRLSEDEDHV